MADLIALGAVTVATPGVPVPLCPAALQSLYNTIPLSGLVVKALRPGTGGGQTTGVVYLIKGNGTVAAQKTTYSNILYDFRLPNDFVSFGNEGMNNIILQSLWVDADNAGDGCFSMIEIY